MHFATVHFANVHFANCALCKLCTF